MDYFIPFIVDDLLPQEVFNKVCNTVTSSKVPWYFFSSTLPPDSKLTDKDTFQFVHTLRNSEGSTTTPYLHDMWSEIMHYVTSKTGLDIVAVHRAKLNLMTKSNDKDPQPAHIDLYTNDCITFLLYLNETEGDTILYNNFVNDVPQGSIPLLDTTLYMRIAPKPNRAVFFESNRYHSSSAPYITDTRVVLTTVFKYKDERIIKTYI
jgi:hypothetical protein